MSEKTIPPEVKNLRVQTEPAKLSKGSTFDWVTEYGEYWWLSLDPMCSERAEAMFERDSLGTGV